MSKRASKKWFRTSIVSEGHINKQNIHYNYNILQKNTIGFRIKYKLLTSNRKKVLQTSEASEDPINKQTFNNGHRKLQKLPLYSGKDCFKSDYNL